MENQNNEESEYLLVPEAEVFLGVKRRTLDRYALKGILKKYRRGILGTVMYKRVDLERIQELRQEIRPDEREN